MTAEVSNESSTLSILAFSKAKSVKQRAHRIMVGKFIRVDAAIYCFFFNFAKV